MFCSVLYGGPLHVIFYKMKTPLRGASASLLKRSPRTRRRMTGGGSDKTTNRKHLLSPDQTPYKKTIKKQSSTVTEGLRDPQWGRGERQMERERERGVKREYVGGKGGKTSVFSRPGWSQPICAPLLEQSRAPWVCSPSSTSRSPAPERRSHSGL